MLVSSPDQVRTLSQVVFGQRYRLEVMVAIASSDSGTVCLTDLAKQLNVTASNLQRPLADLLQAGLLSPLPHPNSKRKLYRRRDSLGWAFAVELCSIAGGCSG